MIRRILFCLFSSVLSVAALPGGFALASTPHPGPPADGETLSSWYLHYSVEGRKDLFGAQSDVSGVERELARLSDRVRPLLSSATTGEQVVAAFNRVLLKEEGFSYDGIAGDPENFLIGSVLSRKRGNCLGLSMLYLALAERLSVPFRGVCVPSHCFVRYEGKGDVRNVEFASRGEEWGDDRYRREFRIGPGRPYLRSLVGTEMLGVFLKSLGAAYSKKGREEDALHLYDEAVRFFPGLPEAYFNAGVSLQRMGRFDEAAMRYRGSLALDPDLAPARDNLGIVLAIRGNFAEAIPEGRRAVELEPRNAAMRRNLATIFCASGNIEEGIRQFLAAVEIAPRNSRTREGLAMSYLALGRYQEAAKEFDIAQALGVRIEPSMLQKLERHRPPSLPGS
ncbi:MAG: transglutaminase family protein [bacterium]|jgi:Flp pilus assembly protein TadD